MPRHLPISHSDPHRKLFPSYPSWNYQQVCRQKTQWLEDYNNFPSLGSRTRPIFPGGNRTISEVLDLLICALGWNNVCQELWYFFDFFFGEKDQGTTKKFLIFAKVIPDFFWETFKSWSKNMLPFLSFMVLKWWDKHAALAIHGRIGDLFLAIHRDLMHDAPRSISFNDANKMMPHGPKV